MLRRIVTVTAATMTLFALAMGPARSATTADDVLADVIARHGKYQENLDLLVPCSSSGSIDELRQAFRTKQRRLASTAAEAMATALPTEIEAAVAAKLTNVDDGAKADAFAADLTEALDQRSVETYALRLRASRFQRRQAMASAATDPADATDHTGLVDRLYLEDDDEAARALVRTLTEAASTTTKASSTASNPVAAIDAAAINAANPKVHSWAVMDVESGAWTGGNARTRPRSVASTIKLAVVNAVLHQIKAGAIRADETLTVRGPNDASDDGEPIGQKYTVANAIYHTLKRSSNTCPNLLAIRLGGLGPTRRLLTKLGYETTVYNYLSARNRTESLTPGSTAREMAMVGRDFYTTYRHVLGLGAGSPWDGFSHAQDLIKAKGHETLGGKIGSNSLCATNTGLFKVAGRVYCITVFSEENGLANNYYADTYLNKASTDIANAIARAASGSGSGGGSGGGACSKKTGVVIGDSTLNVREGPSTSYGILGTVNRGDVVVIVEERNGWYRIEHPRLEGWVSGNYVRIGGC